METLLNILAICFCLWKLWQYYKFIEKSTKAASWPTTIGYIVFCDLETVWRKFPKYRVEVIYSYIVDDREYKNNTLAFGYMESSSKVQHEKILTQLRYAESVRVSYDPDNPKSSALSYGIHRSLKFPILLGCAFLLFIISAFLGGVFNSSISVFFGLVFILVGCIAVILLEYGSDRVLLKNLVTY